MEQQLQKQKQPWKKLEEEEEEEEEQVASLSRRTNGHTHHTNGVNHEVEAESDETSATTAPTAAATSFPVEEEQKEGDEASSKLHKNSVYLDSHQGKCLFHFFYLPEMLSVSTCHELLTISRKLKPIECY